MVRNGQFLRDGKASHSPCIWMSARPIHGVAFLSSWFTLNGVCCCCEEIWSKRTRVFEDDVFIENTRRVGGSKTQGICRPPHLTGKYGTRPFLGGTGRRAVAHTCPEFPKMPTAPSAFPLLGAPQAPGDKPNLPEVSKSLGERPPEAVGNTPQEPRHTRPDPRPDNTAGQSATRHLERSRPRAICHQTGRWSDWLKNAGLEFTRGLSFKHVTWSSWPMVSRDWICERPPSLWEQVAYRPK